MLQFPSSLCHRSITSPSLWRLFLAPAGTSHLTSSRWEMVKVTVRLAAAGFEWNRPLEQRAVGSATCAGPGRERRGPWMELRPCSEKQQQEWHVRLLHRSQGHKSSSSHINKHASTTGEEGSRAPPSSRLSFSLSDSAPLNCSDKSKDLKVF